MPALSDATIRLFKGIAKREATGEGGLLTGMDPSAFNTSDPLRLWIIQVGVIIMMAQLLSLGLARMKQPKVIAEVLGGILLGPTAFGRIPGFTQHIFPSDSLPYLSLVANIGLCLFLFLVGLEIEASIIKRNARLSVIVSLAGMALPFGLGSALSIPLYHHFIDPSVHFTYFMLFTGVAYSITAFPVLCRILTELKLLDTTVGIIVLSAGVGNDVVGWTLLALSVALVNAGSGITALWILLTCVGFTIFLLWPVKMAMLWLARRTGSTENGPTMFYMTTVMILLWACAFFTDIVGVNAIFGAFLAGIIVPREGGLAIALTEKLEDMVSIVFLPLYFTLSGLNTNLGLLNNGITWAFTIAIACLAFSGKFGGCTIAAKLCGFGWREASTIGALMSCKGLVELIVLNVGLEAGILSQRVFSMFVLEALTLTFMTTPLVTALYPPEHRVRVSDFGHAHVPAGSEIGKESMDQVSIVPEDRPWRHRFTVVLDKLDHMPGVMAMTQLIAPPSSGVSSATTTTTQSGLREADISVSVDALRLIELSDRTSAVMKSSVADTLIHTDPLLGIFRMFGELNDLPVSTSLSVVPYDDLAHSVVEHAQKHTSQLILVPWLPPHTQPASVETTDNTGTNTPLTPRIVGNRGDSNTNPFEAFFGSVSRGDTTSASAIQSQFVRSVFAQSKTDVAMFVDTGDRVGVGMNMAMGGGSQQHVFCPFFGGPDDRLALELVVQLCLNPRMSATVVRICRREGGGMGVDAGVMHGGDGVERPPAMHLGDEKADVSALPPTGFTFSTTTGLPDTVYGQATTQTRLQSETADNMTWSRFASPIFDDEDPSSLPPPPSSLRTALSRISFSTLSTPTPLHTCIQLATHLRETHARLVVVTGRSRRLAVENHHQELKALLEEYHVHQGDVFRKTLGDVGTAVVLAGTGAARSVLVVQAAQLPLE